MRSRDLAALRRRAAEEPGFLRALDNCGDTPLSIAVQFRFVEGVRSLLELGADPGGPQEGADYTCLMSAVEAWDDNAPERDMQEIVRLLVGSGADTEEIHAVNGDTALHLAAALGRPAAVRALVASGARIDSVDVECGETPLMQAAAAGHVDAVEALLSCGADVDLRSREPESTPLLEAASAGHLAVTRTLLAAGADPRAHDDEGRSAVDLARQCGGADADAIAQVLRDAGAEP